IYGIRVVRETGGWGEDVTDEELVDGMKILAETEGVFTETAGGVVVAVARKLVKQGLINSDDLTVLCITGHGLKTQEAVIGKIGQPVVIEP
ncbi:pyridoxal-phosphate dependent enzyme, partial [Nitrospinae bacterium AH_259_B05_G02_I21]|nr:pyridoxal-phosphate dependent enzyme [Nitrospinae bacterium AH_259_B05_G02_I21]